MKYLKLNPFYVQLENIAYMELTTGKSADAETAAARDTAKIYFVGLPNPLEIREPEQIAIIRRHFD